MMKKLLLFTTVLLSVFCATAQVKSTTAKKPATTLKKPVTTAKKPVALPGRISTTRVATKIDMSAPGTYIKITTDSGQIFVRLYDSTTLHRDNFVKMVKEKKYDSLMFHRVIPGFMIQGGDPTSKNAPGGTMLGSGGGDMQRIPAEIMPKYIHKKGALAAARDGNPEKASSAMQFYLVDGQLVSDEELNTYEQNRGEKYTPGQRAIYKSVGGTAMLDGNYTVFGETISGLNVIDKIAKAARDQNNRPLGDIRMKMEILKTVMKK